MTMPATFLVVPQWQGSGSSRAMRLIDGAKAISGDLPVASTVSVDVPPGAGSDLGTKVHRLSAVQFVRDELKATLQDVAAPAITIGGDCGVELGAIDQANATEGLAVLWIDAHPDLNTPETSPTGAFHGMVLRTLLGDGPAELAPEHPLTAPAVVLVGTRAMDDAESDVISDRGIPVLTPAETTAESIAAALVATGATRVYIHIDLDCLDPSALVCVSYPEPFGLTVQQLLDVITAARRALPLAGAAITEFAPGTPDDASDDLPTILRIVGALTKPLQPQPVQREPRSSQS